MANIYKHPYVTQTMDTIRQARLCEGCEIGLNGIRRAAQLAIQQAEDAATTESELENRIIGNAKPGTVIRAIMVKDNTRSGTVSYHEGRELIRQECLSAIILPRIVQFGKMNQEAPSEAGVRKTDLPRLDREPWRDEVGEAFVEEMRDKIATLNLPDNRPDILCELDVRNIERMRNELLGNIDLLG